MDEKSKSTDEWARKRELANARMRKYRTKKRSTFKRLDSLAQNEPVTEEMKNIKKQQIEEEKAQQRKELAKERSRRYRERKRINTLESVDHFIHDSQIPGRSHANPPFVTRDRSRVEPGTSTAPGLTIVKTDSGESSHIVSGDYQAVELRTLTASGLTLKTEPGESSSTRDYQASEPEYAPAPEISIVKVESLDEPSISTARDISNDPLDTRCQSPSGISDFGSDDGVLDTPQIIYLKQQLRQTRNQLKHKNQIIQENNVKLKLKDKEIKELKTSNKTKDDKIESLEKANNRLGEINKTMKLVLVKMRRLLENNQLSDKTSNVDTDDSTGLNDVNMDF